MEIQLILLLLVWVDYKVPIHLGDRLSIVVWVGHIGYQSWEFSYKIYNQKTNVIHVEAKSIQVAYDYQTNGSVVLNDDIKQYLNELHNL